MHGRLTVRGVSIIGARVKSIVLERGRLVVTLRRSVSSLIVKLRVHSVTESAWLVNKAKRHLIRSLKLSVLIKDSARKSTTVAMQIRNLHL
jgi:hypothetical protein